jgi:hypothetical protein
MLKNTKKQSKRKLERVIHGVDTLQECETFKTKKKNSSLGLGVLHGLVYCQGFYNRFASFWTEIGHIKTA